MRTAFVVLILLTACSGRQQPDAGVTFVATHSVEFRGIYAAGFEVSSFQPCDVAERWWVADTGPLYRAYGAVATRPYQQVYAVVRGDTTARGYAGHLGLYQRYLRIHDVVSVSEIEQQQVAGAVTCPEAVHGP